MQRVYGVLTELKAEMLYQRCKISSKEYEKILDWLNTPTAEEETALQELKEQQAEEKDLVQIDVPEKFNHGNKTKHDSSEKVRKEWF
ncbi:MAG: hypothetical protein QME47_05985 [Candidatus Thermoplasmatota archaeon]|nr:hypothetical protein [Candidatus Thermoplasmatota archaeon]